MKKALIIFGILLILLLGVFAYLWLTAQKPVQNAGSQTTSSTTFPSGGYATSTNSSGGSQGTFSVTATDGSMITTRNFLSDPGVVQNAYSNQGYDLLVGNTSALGPNPPYEIDYSAKDRSFGITLYQEPLGSERIQAENDLMHRLGISQADMCRLNYVISAGPGISPIYSSENLLFSFCPGAVPLP